jgi:hypothetical protein
MGLPSRLCIGEGSSAIGKEGDADGAVPGV